MASNCKKLLFILSLGVWIFVLLPRNMYSTIEIFDPLGEKIHSFEDREISYGDDVLIMEGYIVLADPPEACDAIKELTFQTNVTIGRFVLINGTDECELDTKISNAEKANFDVAVIFDPSPSPTKYGTVGVNINISVILIPFEQGVLIKNNYLYDSSKVYNYRLKIELNILDVSSFKYLSIVLLGISILVLICYVIHFLIKCIRKKMLLNSQLRNIPTAKFAKDDQYNPCAICFEDYKVGDKLRMLPCSHVYHAKCIDPWLMKENRNCPLCKRKIIFSESAVESVPGDSELMSPTEHTPLLASSSNFSDRNAALEAYLAQRRHRVIQILCANNSSLESAGSVSAENSSLVSDSNSEYLTPSPSPNLSVNNDNNAATSQ